MPEGEPAHSTVQEEKQRIANLCNVGWVQENMPPSSSSQNWLGGKTFELRNSESTISNLQLVATVLSFEDLGDFPRDLRVNPVALLL